MPLLYLAGAAAVGWIGSDVSDAVSSKNNRLFWAVAGAAGAYYLLKKKG